MITVLALLLSLKIAVTLIFVALPLLTFPVDTVRRFTGLEGAPLLIRLYGIALLALLVGYGYGLREALGGWMPNGVLVMGIVSNGGAAFALQSAGGRYALASILFMGVALALAVCLTWPNLAMTRVL